MAPAGRLWGKDVCRVGKLFPERLSSIKEAKSAIWDVGRLDPKAAGTARFGWLKLRRFFRLFFFLDKCGDPGVSFKEGGEEAVFDKDDDELGSCASDSIGEYGCKAASDSIGEYEIGEVEDGRGDPRGEGFGDGRVAFDATLSLFSFTALSVKSSRFFGEL